MMELENAPRPPMSWHYGLREINGLARDDRDVYMTIEQYIGPDETLVALISVLDEAGFAGLPQGIYLLTDRTAENMFSNQPEEIRITGYVMDFVASAIAGKHNPSIEHVEVPEQIRIETPIPPNVHVDMSNGFMLVYLEAKLEGYPIYDVRPMTASEKQEGLSMLPEMEVHLRK